MVDIVKEAVEQVNRAFNEFREANDERLKKLATSEAVSDALAKMAKTEEVMDRFENLSQQMQAEERARKAMEEQLGKIQALLQRPGATPGQAEEENAKLTVAFNHCMRTRDFARNAEHVETLKRYANTMVKGDDAGGGYLLAPPTVEREIQRMIIDLSPIRQIARVITIGGHSYKWPKETAVPSAKRVGETETRTDGDDPKYGMGEMQAPEMYSRNRVSQQMLEDADWDLLAELRTGVSKQMAVKEGQESINGNGFNAQQMEGMLKADGIGEVVSGNASQLTSDGLINLMFELHSTYARNALWLLNRKTLRDIRKLKDGQGNYLWVPGFGTAVANTILGSTYVEFPDLPDIGAGNYPILWGDFKEGFTVVDRVGLGFLADYVTQADNGLVIYRSRKRVGGGVKDARAIKKLKVAAS